MRPVSEHQHQICSGDYPQLNHVPAASLFCFFLFFLGWGGAKALATNLCHMEEVERNKPRNRDSNQIRLSKSFVPISFDKSSFGGAPAANGVASGVSRISLCSLMGPLEKVPHTQGISSVIPRRELNPPRRCSPCRRSNTAPWWRLLTTAARYRSLSGTFLSCLTLLGQKMIAAVKTASLVAVLFIV